MSDAIQQINFYVNEAPPELLHEREEYLTSVFIPWLKRGLENTTRWVRQDPDDTEMRELHNAYQTGVKFFTTWEKERAA